MSHSHVAVVYLKVANKFSDPNLNAVQALLRAYGKATISNIDDDEMRFYIWDEKGIDYAILDQVKDKLHEQEVTEFVLSADEYILVGQKYHYVEGKAN